MNQLRLRHFILAMCTALPLFLFACDTGELPSDDLLTFCTNHSDCEIGESCIGGLCERVQVTRCDSNIQCESGKCNTHEGVCEPVSSGDGDGGDGNTDIGDGGDGNNGDGNSGDGGDGDGGDGSIGDGGDGDGGDGDGGDGSNGDGGDGDGGDGPVVEPGGPCNSKYDCPDNYTCLNNTCQEPRSNCNSSDQCPRGKICDFTRKCVDGCEDGRDCPAGELCHPNRFVCETCSTANPCPAGQVCNNSVCETPKTCSSSAQCNQQQPGTICEGGQCVNCRSHSVCDQDPYKYGSDKKAICATDGLCREPTCSDDQCVKDHGNLYFCNTTSGSCAKRECATDADCPSQAMACNPLTFRCEVLTGCDGADLNTCHNSCSSNGRLCDELRCTCYEGSGIGEACISDFECAPNLGCALGICMGVCEGGINIGGVTIGATCSTTGKSCGVAEFLMELMFGFAACE